MRSRPYARGDVKVLPANKGKQMATSKKSNEQLPAVSYDYGNMAGGGFEGTTHEDFTMPFLNLLQPMSPVVGSDSNARPGMLQNSVTGELVPGDEGIILVPVARQHVFCEWRPRESGGGIVARHEPTSEVVLEAKAASTSWGQYATKGGNDLVETFYLIGYRLRNEDDTDPSEVLVVPFWASKIKVYKRVMQMLNTYKGRPPLFANRLRVKTMQEKNSSGSFWNYDIRPLNGGVGESLIAPKAGDGSMHPLLMFGQSLNKQVLAGERRMADESLADDEPDGKVPF